MFVIFLKIYAKFTMRHDWLRLQLDLALGVDRHCPFKPSAYYGHFLRAGAASVTKQHFWLWFIVSRSTQIFKDAPRACFLCISFVLWRTKELVFVVLGIPKRFLGAHRVCLLLFSAGSSFQSACRASQWAVGPIQMLRKLSSCLEGVSLQRGYEICSYNLHFILFSLYRHHLKLSLF